MPPYIVNGARVSVNALSYSVATKIKEQKKKKKAQRRIHLNDACASIFLQIFEFLASLSLDLTYLQPRRGARRRSHYSLVCAKDINDLVCESVAGRRLRHWGPMTIVEPTITYGRERTKGQRAILQCRAKKNDMKTRLNSLMSASRWRCWRISNLCPTFLSRKRERRTHRCAGKKRKKSEAERNGDTRRWAARRAFGQRRGSRKQARKDREGPLAYVFIGDLVLVIQEAFLPSFPAPSLFKPSISHLPAVFSFLFFDENPSPFALSSSPSLPLRASISLCLLEKPRVLRVVRRFLLNITSGANCETFPPSIGSPSRL